MKKFVVSYELDYIHLVRVGITAADEETAKAIAQAAFDNGTLWDNTADMPLLYDEFEEVDNGRCLEFETQEVGQFPKPDPSVKALREREAAFQACQSLIKAYRLGEDRSYFAWGDVDQAYQLALKAMPHLATGRDAPSLDVVRC